MNDHVLTDEEPQPYRSPLGWNNPTIIDQSCTPTVQVSFPNEDPEFEDDLTLSVKFTDEGIIMDLMVSDGQVVATRGMTYEEWADSCH